MAASKNSLTIGAWKMHTVTDLKCLGLQWSLKSAVASSIMSAMSAADELMFPKIINGHILEL